MTKVRIEAREDDDLIYGHALLTFHHAYTSDGPIRLIVSRISKEKPFLGLDGWQAGPAEIDVKLLSQVGGKTVVRAGPVICDMIPCNVQVDLRISGTDIHGEVVWPSIHTVPGGYKGHLVGGKPRPPEPPESPPEPTPPPLPVPKPELPVPPQIPLPPTGDTASDKTEPEKPPTSRRSFVWLYLLLLLLLAGSGGLVYYVKFQPVAPPPETLAQRFERLRNTDTRGDDLLALSRDAFAAQDNTIGRQAIDLAIRLRNQAAMLEMARWYDPQTFARDRVPAIDANRAGRTYFKLHLGNNPDATKLLQSLCEASRRGGPNFSGFLGNIYCVGMTRP